MKTKTTLPYSKDWILKGLDCLKVDIELEKELPIDLHKLFALGIRKNTKRAFLFVSKVLGKHISVHPCIPQVGGLLLTSLYAKSLGIDTDETVERLLKCLEDEEYLKMYFDELVAIRYEIEEPTLFIGFAETATALGHSMFSGFKGNVMYIHTTRDEITNVEPTFVFKEEHSHAVGHYCYTKEPGFFERFKHIVLVDDELTTGKTAINLVAALQAVYEGKTYAVATLLDWRSQSQQAAMTHIPVVSLIKGTISPRLLKEVDKEKVSQIYIQDGTTEHNSFYEEHFIELERPFIYEVKGTNQAISKLLYLKSGGRFGLTYEEQVQLERRLDEVSYNLSSTRKGKRTLCMGTEELMYIPCKLARGLGENVWYQSTTQSPIVTAQVEGYPIQNAIIYHRPEKEEVMCYIYNIVSGQYDEVYWVLERDVPVSFKKKISKILKAYGIQYVHYVICIGMKGK